MARILSLAFATNREKWLSVGKLYSQNQLKSHDSVQYVQYADTIIPLLSAFDLLNLVGHKIKRR